MSKFFRNKVIMLRSILASIPFCLRLKAINSFPKFTENAVP